MKKQPEITDATRNIFIQAFCDLYATMPIEQITVKELVKKAGYSRATFYNYFRDVYELLEYVENAFISALTEIILHHIEQEQPLDNFVYDFMELIGSQRMYIHVFMSSANSSAFLYRLKEKVMPLLLLAFHISADNHRAKYALEFYISGLIPTLGTWLKDPKGFSAESLALLVKGILQDGLLMQLKE